jgi:hypothetical protein
MRKQLISRGGDRRPSRGVPDTPPTARAQARAPAMIRDARVETTIGAHATPLFVAGSRTPERSRKIS